MAKSVIIVSNRETNTFKLVVDGQALTNVKSYELKESAESFPRLTVTMEVLGTIEARLGEHS